MLHLQADFFCRAISIDSDLTAQTAMLDKIASLPGKAVDDGTLLGFRWLPALLSLCSREHWALAEYVLHSIVGQPNEVFIAQLVLDLVDLGLTMGSKLMDA